MAIDSPEILIVLLFAILVGGLASGFPVPFVMLGASWATPKPLIRRSFRNWFQDRYPFVFAGFRTVEAV